MIPATRQGVDLSFLALVLWREARGEPLIAKAGVACAVLNRVRKPGWWGKDVLSVLFKKWQFSSVTDPGDPQLTKFPTWDDKSWVECVDVAEAAVKGKLFNPVPGADSYYDVSIAPPKWATPDKFVNQLGRLRFYNLDGDPA